MSKIQAQPTNNKVAEPKAGPAETATTVREIGLRDVKRNARNIKYAIETLEDLGKTSTSVKKAVSDSKIVDVLKAEVSKLRDLAMKIALVEFDGDGE